MDIFPLYKNIIDMSLLYKILDIFKEDGSIDEQIDITDNDDDVDLGSN